MLLPQNNKPCIPCFFTRVPERFLKYLSSRKVFKRQRDKNQGQMRDSQHVGYGWLFKASQEIIEKSPLFSFYNQPLKTAAELLLVLMEQEEKKDNPDNEGNATSKLTLIPEHRIQCKRRQTGGSRKLNHMKQETECQQGMLSSTRFSSPFLIFIFLQRWNMGSSYAFRI